MKSFNPNTILKDYDANDDYQDPPCEICAGEPNFCRICLQSFRHSERHCECGLCRHMEPIYKD